MNGYWFNGTGAGGGESPFPPAHSEYTEGYTAYNYGTVDYVVFPYTPKYVSPIFDVPIYTIPRNGWLNSNLENVPYVGNEDKFPNVGLLMRGVVLSGTGVTQETIDEWRIEAKQTLDEEPIDPSSVTNKQNKKYIGTVGTGSGQVTKTGLNIIGQEARLTGGAFGTIGNGITYNPYIQVSPLAPFGTVGYPPGISQIIEKVNLSTPGIPVGSYIYEEYYLYGL